VMLRSLTDVDLEDHGRSCSSIHARKAV
jgi:hypothetical protein